ncbi:two-component sensor histidine kinase [Mycolicibacterium helvum]|uniref:histidine kinase n=2 Tax=Mycolicibacterium helvum TaxID=1534349 RepID=A0A7I7TFB6_9MYCO|nr:two-component sensor histidine kinase [Mycolicibacterium helvum]
MGGVSLRMPRWSIATRSAVIAGVVVLVALAIAGAGLTALFYRSLIAGVDAAASGRVRDVAAGLQEDPPAQLDDPLLATDQRIDEVQIIDTHGAVVRKSDSAPDNPLVAPDKIGNTLLVGIVPDLPIDSDMRISAQTLDSPNGRFTVLVAGGDEAVESTVQTAAILLLLAAPVVMGVAGVATYRLVRRSLRSVDAIRAQVAAISTSDLAERVPVPSSNDEITALALTMNDMLARIEAGHAAQRRFVGDASHELRSPLTAIISALDVAIAHPDLLDVDLARETLVPEAQRMRTLVEDLLLLARADERGLVLHRELVRLDEIAVGELARLRRTCTHATHIHACEVELSGDGRALSRVVRNLLENAARHAFSRVEIVVSEDCDFAVLTVSDDGPGIPPADRLRVFDRFVRLDSARSRAGGGTGLGLSIAAEIVNAHGGTITVADRLGGGTVVKVQLPLRAASDSSR